MSLLSDQAFIYRNRHYYFCGEGGLAYPLEPGEAAKYRFRLNALFTLTMVGLVGWAALSFALIGQQFDFADPILPAWAANGAILYPAVVSYWIFAVVFSSVTWAGLSARCAEREPDLNLCSSHSNQIVKSTKPLPVLAVGAFMTAFVAQGLGDVCFLYRGIGHCEIIKFNFSSLLTGLA